jgi:hypothetical protein
MEGRRVALYIHKLSVCLGRRPHGTAPWNCPLSETAVAAYMWRTVTPRAGDSCLEEPNLAYLPLRIVFIVLCLSLQSTSSLHLIYYGKWLHSPVLSKYLNYPPILSKYLNCPLYWFLKLIPLSKYQSPNYLINLSIADLSLKRMHI